MIPWFKKFNSQSHTILSCNDFFLFLFVCLLISCSGLLKVLFSYLFSFLIMFTTTNSSPFSSVHCFLFFYFNIYLSIYFFFSFFSHYFLIISYLCTHISFMFWRLQFNMFYIYIYVLGKEDVSVGDGRNGKL